MLRRIRKTWLNLHPSIVTRTISLNQPRPSPPPLPKKDQQEFEELVRKVHATLDPTAGLHPDARKPAKPGFDGEVNPETGEKGGPKREPVGRWGDWSFNGRASDF